MNANKATPSRDPHWRKLAERPRGNMDNRPRRVRTRATLKRQAVRDQDSVDRDGF